MEARGPTAGSCWSQEGGQAVWLQSGHLTIEPPLCHSGNGYVSPGLQSVICGSEMQNPKPEFSS